MKFRIPIVKILFFFLICLKVRVGIRDRTVKLTCTYKRIGENPNTYFKYNRIQIHKKIFFS